MVGVKIDRLVRTKRETVALQINDRAEIVVRAPRWVSLDFINSFVIKHTDWIEKRKKEIGKKQARTKKFVDGDEFLFLGKKYILSRIHPVQGRTLDKSKILITEEGVLYLSESINDPKSVLEKWYKKQAKDVIVKRVDELAQKHGFLYNRIRITSARTRWGSCSSKKNLNFSWRLIMVPQEVIDYVVVHELTHLKHMDHSSAFWRAVEALCPNYKQCRKRLNKTVGLW